MEQGQSVGAGLLAVEQVDREARKRFYDTTDANLSDETLAKLDEAFARHRERTAVDLAVAMVRIAVNAGLDEYSIKLDEGDLDGRMTGPWVITVAPPAPSSLAEQGQAFCNKCGFCGTPDENGFHKRPRDGVMCNYTAIPGASPGLAAQNAALVEALAKVMPVRVQNGPDYAEVYFADGSAHSTQAMTMNPQDWLDLQAAYDAALATKGAA